MDPSTCAMSIRAHWHLIRLKLQEVIVGGEQNSNKIKCVAGSAFFFCLSTLLLENVFFFLVKILYAWNYALFTAMLPQEALVVWVHGRSRLAVEHLCKVFRVLNSTIHTPSWRGVFISPQLFTRQKRIVGDYVDQYHYH